MQVSDVYGLGADLAQAHQLLPNMTKFPDGIKGLADKIHGMGMKFGIYSSAGTSSTVHSSPAIVNQEKQVSSPAEDIRRLLGSSNVYKPS